MQMPAPSQHFSHAVSSLYAFVSLREVSLSVFLCASVLSNAVVG